MEAARAARSIRAESTRALPFFAEMATPGVSFEGDWREKSISDRNKIFQSANRYAAGLPCSSQRSMHSGPACRSSRRN
jgi:hypothetical protein